MDIARQDLDKKLLPQDVDLRSEAGSRTRTKSLLVDSESGKVVRISEFEWRGVTYTVKNSSRDRKETGSNTKNILTGVYGSAKAGEITAIIGKSGAGKTSLLNILAQRVSWGRLAEGAFSINKGATANPRLLRENSSYLRQEDIYHTALTPYEVMMNAANFLVKGNHARRVRVVNELINDLNLEECKNNVIGSFFGKGGISGGQKRRLSLALELMTDPDVLFLDEPTSGLDSFTALLVMSIIKREAG